MSFSKSIAGLALLFVTTTHAGNFVVEQGSADYEIKASGEVNYVVMEIEAACVLTFNPRLADDEDTSASRLIIRSKEAFAAKEAFRKQGYGKEVLLNGESCSEGNFTFPQVVAPDGDLYFSIFEIGDMLKSGDLQKRISEQNAYKKIKIALIAGFGEISEKAKKAGLDAAFKITDKFKKAN